MFRYHSYESLLTQPFLQFYFTACPETVYATPEDECCLNFKFTIMPDPDNPADQVAVAEFESQLETAIDEEGQLYDIVKAANPETFITGLGSPGKGGDGDREVDASTGGGGEEEDSGLSTGFIILIILLVILVPLAILAMFARYRKVQEEERLRRLREFNEQQSKDLEEPAEEEPVPDAAPEDDDESSAPSVWSESADVSNVESSTMVDDDAAPALTAGSALAAMGAAGAAATMAKKSQKPE